ncbi:MAG: FHA domain-containing protein [Lachnospiraceae bacterium]|nr:FHA domain-containing protein [Lachnospiraceae bacterium]
MIVTLLEKERMNSLLLPEKGKGRYWLRDRINGKKIISIKRNRSHWILELNEEIRIPKEGYQDADMVYLYPSTLYTLYQKGTESILYLMTESEDIGCREYIRYTVNGNEDVYIGRSRKNAVCFRNTAVSSVHARLTRNSDTWILHDENSKNGVYVNYIRIQGRCRLCPGDMVYIMGLRIIIGKGFLAVNNPDRGVNLDRKRFSVLKKRLVSGVKQRGSKIQKVESVIRHMHKKQTGEVYAGYNQTFVKEDIILSVEECIDTIMKRKEGLWNREPMQEDFLKLNVGEDSTLVDLKKYPMTGISGKWVDVLAFTKGLLLQMITYYRYDDLKIVFLLNKEAERELKTARWLPHVWDDEKQMHLFAYDAKQRNEILKSVIEEAKKETGKNKPHYMVFVCKQEIEDRQIQCFYDSDIGDYVKILFLSDGSSFLPQICKAIISLEGNIGKIYDKVKKQETDFTPVYVKQDIDLCYLQLANLGLEKNWFAGHRVVELYLPAIGAGFDVRIPDNCRIGEIIPVMVKTLKKETQGAFCSKGVVLCEREAGIVLNTELTPEQHGILNGTRLMLI